MEPAARRARRLLHGLAARAGYRVIPAGHIGVDLRADLLRACGPGAQVALDVGAHTGGSAAVMRELFPRAVLHCFEPAPEPLAAARARLAGDPLARFHAHALAEREGRAALHRLAGDLASSLLRVSPDLTPHAPRELFRPSGDLDVRVRTLDDCCAELGIGEVDLLKVDTQGGEAGVLRGAAGLLGRRAARAVVLELLFARYYEGQPFFEEIYGLMAAHGYRLVGLYDAVRAPDMAVLACAGLFVA